MAGKGIRIFRTVGVPEVLEPAGVVIAGSFAVAQEMVFRLNSYCERKGRPERYAVGEEVELSALDDSPWALPD